MADGLHNRDMADQVFALVESDPELRKVHLRILRDDPAVNGRGEGRLVGRIVVDGIAFRVYAEDRGDAPAEDGLARLTSREMQIACLVKEGACNKQIARLLRISPYTVASYLKRMFPKLGCSSRAELAAKVAEVQSTAAPRRP